MTYDTTDLTTEKAFCMLKKIESNGDIVLVKLGELTEIVRQLNEEVHSLKKQVSQHQEQLLILNKAIEWTIKYGGKIVAAVAFLTLTYEGLKKVIPHL